MAGYNDTKEKIIGTLVGRPNGTQITPEGHQDFALSILEYIRVLESSLQGSLAGIAEENTIPIQPDSSNASYISGVGQNSSITFHNFIDANGSPITVETGEVEGKLIILYWNRAFWSFLAIPTSVVSKSENASFQYRFNIRKTYPSKRDMEADVSNPVDANGEKIKVGELVSVVNNEDPVDNGVYSYNKTEFKFQGSMSTEVVQTLGDSTGKVMSQKAVKQALESVKNDIRDGITEIVDYSLRDTKEELERVSAQSDSNSSSLTAFGRKVRDAEKSVNEITQTLHSISVARFHEITEEQNLDVKIDEIQTPSAIIYQKRENRFIARYNGEYYSTWKDSVHYNASNGKVHKDKLYLMGKIIFSFDEGAGTLVESGREFDSAIGDVAKKVQNVMVVNGVLESGASAVTDGIYLRRGGEKNKIVQLVRVSEARETNEIASNGILYSVGNNLYAYNGKEFSPLGENSGAGGGFGSGAGFINITQKSPLASGQYYDIVTAVDALKRIDLEGVDRLGSIITFEASEGVWKDYRFVGNNTGQYFDSSKWSEYPIRDYIKQIFLNNQELIPRNGVVNITIEEKIVDETLNPSSTNPVAGGAVYEALNQIKSTIPSRIRLNSISGGERYTISLLPEDSDEPISTTEEFTAGGGGGNGSVTTNKIVLTRLTGNKTVKTGDTVSLSYRYDHVDTQSGESTGNGGRVVTTITRGANTTNIVETISAGETRTIDISKYLIVGVNNVKVRVETGDGEEKQVSSISWSINVVQLTLTSSYDIATVLRANNGDRASIPYTLTGNGNKTLRCYLDGVDVEDRQISTSLSNGAFSIETARLSHGSHSVQIVAELSLPDGSMIKSNSIYFDIMVRQDGITTPLIGTRFDYQDGTIIAAKQRPYVATKQYDGHVLSYAVFNPVETPTLVNVEENGVGISSARVPLQTNRIEARVTFSGDANGSITCGSVIYQFGIKSEKTALNISEPTDGMTLKLTAQGRSNNDTNKDSWTFGSITTRFEEFNFGGDGWIDGALRHKGRARSTINYKPFEQTVSSDNSFSAVFRFKCTDVVDDNAEVIRCVDDAGTGFIITPTEARFVTSGKNQLSMKMASGKTYEVGFVSFPRASETSSDYEKENTEMVILYINGIMCGCVQRGSSDGIYQIDPQFISLGNDGATLDVYSVRFYSRYLSDDQMLSLHILEQDSAEALINEFNRNDVIDDQGLVSVEDAPDNIRIIIVTGVQANGVPTMLQAAVENNKKKKFDVDEILSFVKGGVPEQNVKILGGCISLQGTSSLAYPTKNYRLYSVNSSKKDGQLYLGCDNSGEGGTLREKPLWSFRLAKGSQYAGFPVNCMCAKADFAESSSSHNTGMARLVNEVLVSIGELTPPQKHVNRGKYKYDVRTTVDGEPALMFYRATKNDKPIFLGKFNLNNDKSTEAVFGFLKIPGYHDAEWVTTHFSGQNPTECWEFLNNDYPMGSFKNDDFDTKGEDGEPLWMKVFEARFPDDKKINAEYAKGTKKPQYLERLVKWVKSTDTAEHGLNSSQIQQRKNKFKTELKDYFDVDYLCDYYMFTDMFACCDQRVKNMMMAFWYHPEKAKMLAYMIFYDNDTILGVRNDGRLKYNWDVNEETIDPELSVGGKTVYAFAGHDSVLWKNLRSEFADELKKAYLRIRRACTNEVIFNMFEKEQTEKFAPRIFNIDAIRKYIDPKTIGVNVNRAGTVTNQKYSYLESMQGDRTAHRRHFVTNRLGLFDAKYSTGQYTSTDITWKGNSAAGATVRAKTAREFYLEFRREGTMMTHQKISKGQTFSYTYGETANIGTIFHLLGGAWINELDLSEWGGFTNLDIPYMPVLEKLVLGRLNKSYGLTEIALGVNVPMLKELDIQNYINIASLNLNRCTRLETVNARGCDKMSSITFAESSPLSSFVVPRNFQTLSLVSLPRITRSGIEFENINNLIGLRVENCSKLDGMELLREILGSSGNKLRYVRISGIKMTGDGSELKEWYDKGLGGIASDGKLINDKCKFVGSYQLTSYLDEAEFDKYRERFDELNIRQPQYTVIEIDDNVLQHANLSNLDNKTGYKFSNEYVPSAHVSKIVSGIHRVLGKQETSGVMSVIRLHDQNSLKYDNGGEFAAAKNAVVNGDQGDIYAYYPSYYYKGVNDTLNMKKYAVFSTDPNPDRPEGRKISGSELRAMETERVQTYATGVRLADCVKTMLSSGDYYQRCYPIVAKIPCEGWKWTYAPMSDAFLGNSLIFFNENDEKIKAVSITPESDYFAQCSNVVVPIPDGAKYFVTCYSSAHAPEAYVWLTNSDNPADWEPDWVYSEEFLVGALPTINKNGKLMSAFDPNIQTLQRNNVMIQDREAVETRGGLTITTYDHIKNIINLFIFFKGARAPFKGKYSSSKHWGEIKEDFMKCGMNEVEKDPNNQEWGYINRNGIKERIQWSQNLLGLCNPNNSVRQHLGRTDLNAKYASEEGSYIRFGQGNTYPFGVFCRATNSQRWGTHNSRWLNFQYVSFGKYMDLLPVMKSSRDYPYNLNQGSFIEGNLDTQYMSVLVWFRYDSWGSDEGVVAVDSHFGRGEENARGDWHGVRLLFDKTIRFIATPEEYEKIPNNF